jgi:mannose-6-phosphate isomerase-like protein (cupin superfamily)
MQKVTILGVVGAIALTAAVLWAQAPNPSCKNCPGTYIPNAEIEAYVKRAIDHGLTDQQVRQVDVGKSNVGIGIVHRRKLDKPAPNSVAEHEFVSEVYHVISGSATLMLGPELVNPQKRPDTLETVRLFNGPGYNSDSIRNGVSYDLKVGDVVIIPAGTGHWFTKIDDHITYLMVRLDPDRVTPHKTEADSKTYLASPPRPR